MLLSLLIWIFHMSLNNEARKTKRSLNARSCGKSVCNSHFKWELLISCHITGAIVPSGSQILITCCPAMKCHWPKLLCNNLQIALYSSFALKRERWRGGVFNILCTHTHTHTHMAASFSYILQFPGSCICRSLRINVLLGKVIDNPKKEIIVSNSQRAFLPGSRRMRAAFSMLMRFRKSSLVFAKGKPGFCIVQF